MTAELSVLCEGKTEYNFVVQVLRGHLGPSFQVFARPIDLGGVKSFEKLAGLIKADIGRSRAHQYVTTMFDLYALPDYPDDPRAEGIKGVARALRIEAAMAGRLPNPRFIPYIQVHEFEALVFVDLDQLPRAFPNGEANGAPEKLRRDVGRLAPEEIDDGPQTAPSKRLERTVETYKEQKPIAGPIITASIGLPRLRAACPHFDQWVGRLERLAAATSPPTNSV